MNGCRPPESAESASAPFSFLAKSLPAALTAAEDGDFVTEENYEDKVLTKYNGPSGNVEIPETVTKIGDSAFKDCVTLKSVTFPANLEEIGGYAFSGCVSLSSVVFPGSLINISNLAFRLCSSLVSVTIPESVIVIDSDTFQNTSITNVCYFGSKEQRNAITGGGKPSGDDIMFHFNVKILEDVFVLDADGSLATYNGFESEVTIPDSVTAIGDRAFSGRNFLKSVTFPKGLTSIGSSAFSDCTSLTSIALPEGVTSISGYAFEGCTSLASVTFPKNVTAIESGAFSDCDALKDVYYTGSEEDWDEITGEGKPSRNNDSITFHFNSTGPDSNGGSSGSGSGGGSSAKDFAVQVGGEVKNGSIEVSPKSVAKGNTITVKVTPDEGYVLDTLTVTDKDGNEIELEKTGDNTYTFKMPEGEVSIKAVFKEAEPAEEKPQITFTDVPANAYYANAVARAAGEAITNGTGWANFSPENVCTRAQIVAFLWRDMAEQ